MVSTPASNFVIETTQPQFIQEIQRVRSLPVRTVPIILIKTRISYTTKSLKPVQNQLLKACEKQTPAQAVLCNMVARPSQFTPSLDSEKNSGMRKIEENDETAKLPFLTQRTTSTPITDPITKPTITTKTTKQQLQVNVRLG